ncbi:MAG: iron complex transport system ATP-binding protein [Comamonadaceae bacterium]|nr:MAG: iron complex transport system ATP-binding protein [Comamonadaceae bacterium]
MSLSVQQLCASYGPRTVLQHGISLQAQAGQVLGIVGPNGSGKSTLVKAVAGQIPSTGTILFKGSAQRPTSIGYMPQDLLAPAALTVLEVVLLGRMQQLRLKVQPDDLQAVRQILQRLGIEALAGRDVRELSGGQRQMVFLAQALVAQPTVLLLDEPISALDICHQLEVLEVVLDMTRQQGLSTLVVLHDLNAAARFCDQVALLQDGRLLACGAPAQVLTEAHVAQAFGVATEALRCSDGSGVLVPLRAIRKLI